MWYYNGARNKGIIKMLTSMQRKAGLWITGAFRTSPTSGVKALAGLLPIPHLLKRMADRAAARFVTLTKTHPLRALVTEEYHGKALLHRISLACLTPRQREKVKGPLVDNTLVCPQISEPIAPVPPQAQPGLRLINRFKEQIGISNVDNVPVIDIRHVELRDYLIDWFANPNAAIVAVDASQPVVAPGQPGRAATAAAVIQRGRARIQLSAVSTGILQALLLDDINEIDILTDLSTAIDRILDCSAHSGQQYSIAACDALKSWLESNPNNIIRIYYTPSDRRWGYLPIHAEAHELACGLQVPGNVGGGKMTIDKFKKQADASALKAWTNQFESPSYRGHNFLALGTLDAGELIPTTVKGGSWMQSAKEAIDQGGNSIYSNALFACMCQAILNHAPIGSYYERFNFTDEPRSCSCGTSLESRDHIIKRCMLYKEPRVVRRLDQLINFLKWNPTAFAFKNAPTGVG
ncbi:hypothetical protein CVT26_007797 [Gymnopilus dilepis]|uniref:Uncharacterized protein n=1 Tax=Gymnopilus dilepis TaxID=231916 RepID=A0A409YJZ9_9AGAR|nr:hypothetical protein CVT26_007797 [Gymnopilus dilepis]